MKKRKKVLVTGSQSYIGSVLTPLLTKNGYDCQGIDSGFIKDCLLFPTSDAPVIYKDVRDITIKDLKGFDAVIHLAGISNDPFKNFDPAKIYDPVRKYTFRLAKLCKKMGIKFIFASSCSVYGKGVEGYSDELSPVFPQTGYSINKLQIEQDLASITDKFFTPIIFRFATAFGLSPRMRFDIVVNMFTAMAYTTSQIVLNSNGQAWRPFIHVRDMSKALMTAIDFDPEAGSICILNAGTTSQNFRIIDLARMVAKEVPGCEVKFLNQADSQVNKELVKDRKIQDGVDSRNYKISFEMIRQSFPGFECDFPVKKGIREMLDKFKDINLTKEKFESIDFYRLQKLESLISQGLMTEEMRWVKS